MADDTRSPSDPLPLPDHPNLDWLRKQAKRRLDELRAANPDARLSDAQFDLARAYGFSSWRALKAHVDSLAVDGRLIQAVQTGDLDALTKLLDEHPDKLHVRGKPYEWTLLHGAAQGGHLAMVKLLLERGLDPNAREKGDNTYPMHWAAAAGHLEVVRVLAGAGGDVVGHGDDHGLDVIGWATCWNNRQAAVVDFLVSRGARHHIFSAIAMNLADEVRRIVAADPAALNSRLTRNDNHRTPLHHAILNRRPEMVSLLMDLGADPLAVDGSGFPATFGASSPDIDRALMEKIREMTFAELTSAARGSRRPNAGAIDLVAALALGDFETAARLVREAPGLLDAGGAGDGALHVMAKRGDLPAVTWLLDRGADANGRWDHWGAMVTPLHLAAAHGHADVVRRLLDAGADTSARDSQHDSDPIGWARFFEQPHVVRILEARARKT